MGKNPAQYGLDDVLLEKPVPYDTIKIDYQVDLRLVADGIDASVSDLQDLNPSLLRLTTPKDQEFELHLPLGTKERYLAAIEPIPPQMRAWWRYHKVAPGDTLASIARTYRTTLKAISQENRIDVAGELEPDAKLIIPLAPGKHAATEDGASYARRATRYRIRKGDTVLSVADNFAVPPIMVRRWNHLKGESLSGRRVLYIHLPVSSRVSDTAKTNTAKPLVPKGLRKTAQDSPVHHKVERGETFSSIASSYKTTVTALKRDNGNLATLRPGMILIIKGAR
jgi:membrane-bound lytic murein transglycosylase D